MINFEDTIINWLKQRLDIHKPNFEVIQVWNFDLTKIEGANPHYNYKGGLWSEPIISYTINKKFLDTQFWVQFFGDVAPAKDQEIDNYFTGVWINGENQVSQALVCTPGSDITHAFQDIVNGHYEPGPHVFDIRIGTARNTRADWQFSLASSWRVMEVRMPKSSVATRNVIV